jgi:hypothetical protein
MGMIGRLTFWNEFGSNFHETCHYDYLRSMRQFGDSNDYQQEARGTHARCFPSGLHSEERVLKNLLHHHTNEIDSAS